MNIIRVTSLEGELNTNSRILNCLKKAVGHRDCSLIVVFPTQSLLRHIQERYFSLPDSRGLGGVRFLLFEGFINEITEALGIAGRRPSPLARELLIARGFDELVRLGELKYLNQAPFNTAYRQAVLGGISEWKRSGLTVEILMEWAAEKSQKERELALLYRKYQDLLNDTGYCEEDLVLGELEALYRRDGLNQNPMGKVILYGFSDLTPLQGDYIKALSLWYDFEAIVDPTPIPDFREFTAKHFPAAPVSTPIEVAVEMDVTSLGILQRQFWTDKPQPNEIAEGDCSLQLLVAGGIYRQATGIARTVKQWLLENDFPSLDHVLIITPQPQEFIRAALPIFRDYDLCLEGTAEPIREFPSVHLFTRCLAAVSADWSWSDMESLIRMFYYGQNSDTADKLVLAIGECYGALSGKNRWLGLFDDEAFLERAAEKELDIFPVRNGLARLAAIPKRASLEKYMMLAMEWFENQPPFLGNEPGLFKRRADDCRAVQLALETLREIAEHSGWVVDYTKEVEINDFQLFYEEYLLSLELKPLPRTVGGIRAVQLREARGLKARLVFITGLEQGTCPKIYINDWKLAPKDRWELKNLGIELETGEQYNLQERISFYWALQTATERLVLISRDQDESGQPLNRSPFLDEILEWFPEIRRNELRYALAPSLPVDFSQCFSKKEKRNRLAAYLTEDAAIIPQPGIDMCLSLVRQPENRFFIERLMEWFAERPGKTAFLEKPVSTRFVRRVYGCDAVFPVTLLEDYQNCPLRFYFKNFLKIKVLPRPELRPGGPDLGTLYHQILHDFADFYRDQSLDKDRWDEYRNKLYDVYRDAFREWRENAANDVVDFILEILGNQMKHVLDHWLETEMEWSARTGGRFRFSGLEWAFGYERGDFDPSSVPDTFRINPDGEEMRLAGKIDRVDSDSEGRFVVYDYKLGKGPGYKDLLDGKRLQIPLYILALEQLRYGESKGVGGGYLGLAAPSRTSGGLWRHSCPGLNGDADPVLSDDQWNEWLESAVRMTGSIVKSIRSGRFFNLSDDCLSYCEYRSACRRQEWEVEKSDEIIG